MMTDDTNTQRVSQILEMNAFDRKTTDIDQAVARRLANLGASSVLFYRQPIEMHSASGATMTAADGTVYLDFYNNVPSVGHSHPKVISAVHEQLKLLNTHTRYVVPIVDQYIESLKQTLPESLENIVMTCSGSEANDLALRLAQQATGGTGTIVTETAYHGNTALAISISPSAVKNGQLANNVITIPAPSPQNYGHNIAEGFRNQVVSALNEFKARNIKPAAFIFDSIFSSDGIFADPAGFLTSAIETLQSAGVIIIADEVQPGFARTGQAFWGFDRHQIVPDIVTMGKPMGNGFPMAAVATRADLLENYCDKVGYFNTFGGNPVAAAAGLAVLQIIAEEDLQNNALKQGALLKKGLEDIASNCNRISDVRGSGLFLGVDLSTDNDLAEPDPGYTVKIIDAMRQRKVLIGAAGKHGATLKIRPPLCLTSRQSEQFLEAFADAVKAT